MKLLRKKERNLRNPPQNSKTWKNARYIQLDSTLIKQHQPMLEKKMVKFRLLECTGYIVLHDAFFHI